MRRNGTDIMAIGAILASAAIGATATLALAGNPFDGGGRAELVCESPLTPESPMGMTWNYAVGQEREVRVRYMPGTPTRATWFYSVDRDGEVRRKRCPRRITVSQIAREAPAIDADRQAQLAALARDLAEARTRLEVIRALESRKIEAEAEATEAVNAATKAYWATAAAYRARATAEAAKAGKGR
jgi:hypothetical protein